MKCRVLIVEDSRTLRRVLARAFARDAECEVVGEAADGEGLVELCRRLRPHVITLDLVLGRVDGVRATAEVMAHCPTPILVVSGASNRGELFSTLDALNAGALDAMEKPDGAEDPMAWAAKVVERARRVARIRVVRHPGALLWPRAPGGAWAPVRTHLPAGRFQIVAMGASTGGPNALRTVLADLPSSFPLPIVVVLHMDPSFGDVLVDWIRPHVRLPVATAADGMPLTAGRGRILVAPPDRHIEVRGGSVRLHRGPEVHSCRPSVDVLFKSVAEDVGPRAIGCLLTGMGKDGAQGLLDMRRRGALTIAQDEATSVVFGMPGEAVRLGAASFVLPLEGIVEMLRKQTGGEGAS